MRRCVALLVLLSCILGLFGCSGYEAQPAETTTATTESQTAPTEDTKPQVGISMPTRDVQRWVTEGDELKDVLQAVGLRVTLQYAEDDAARQVSQIREMLDHGVQCLVITAVDSLALLDVLQEAKEKNVPVLAYDRMLMNTDWVAGYLSFDSKAVGVALGEYIVAGKQLDTAAAEDRSHTIEFFMGSPDDNNALLVYEGVMQVLQPYLDSGVLVCKSGKVLFEDNCVLRWAEDTARQYGEDILSQYYKEEPLEILCTAFDGLAYGCIQALTDAGCTEENWPFVTGQDAELQAAKYILQGKQTMTVFKDTRLLTQQCAKVVKALLDGGVPELQKDQSCNNNVQDVPSWLCQPQVVDSASLEDVLYGSGYYTKDQLEG